MFFHIVYPHSMAAATEAALCFGSTSKPIFGGAGPLRISVVDRGPGIPADQMAKVLRPFQRAEGSRSRETGGCGLGLVIARQLAQTQGWKLELPARPGGGLQASIDVPLAPRAGT